MIFISIVGIFMCGETGSLPGQIDTKAEHNFCYGLGMPPPIFSLIKLYEYSIKGLLGSVKFCSCCVSCPADHCPSLP